jgi:hypothetical protein
MEEQMITQKRMQKYIAWGRKAIGYSMLLLLIRPRALTAQDDAEMAKLKALLRKYNELMAQYEQTKAVAVAANDETFLGDMHDH